MPWWRFKHRLTRHCSPATLQSWATNLMRQHEADGYVDPAGTNLPAGIAYVFSSPPVVHMGPHGDHVVLSWGRGQPSICAGSPTYIPTQPDAEAWAPGIYLVRPSE